MQSDFDIRGLEFRAGVQSDSDRLLERFAGYNLGISGDVGERVGSFRFRELPSAMERHDSSGHLPNTRKSRVSIASATTWLPIYPSP